MTVLCKQWSPAQLFTSPESSSHCVPAALGRAARTVLGGLRWRHNQCTAILQQIHNIACYLACTRWRLGEARGNYSLQQPGPGPGGWVAAASLCSLSPCLCGVSCAGLGGCWLDVAPAVARVRLSPAAAARTTARHHASCQLPATAAAASQLGWLQPSSPGLGITHAKYTLHTSSATSHHKEMLHWAEVLHAATSL